MSRTRILIVEDETGKSDPLAASLRRESYDVDIAAESGSLEKIRLSRPDLIVLNLTRPGMNGFQIARQIRSDRRAACTPIMLLTTEAEESDIVVGLELGADDYVTKPFSTAVLLARIGALLRRAAEQRVDETSLIAIGPIIIDAQRHEVQVDGKVVALTLTEFRILAALAGAHGAVLSRDQLIDQSRGADAVVTGRTVDVHLTALRRKLGKARKHIHTVRGLGYKLTHAEKA